MVSNKIFDKLKTFLERYESGLSVVHNKSDDYYLNTPITDTNKKSEFFGAVQIKKTYVITFNACLLLSRTFRKH